MLVWEEADLQKPIYYTSKILYSVKLRYYYIKKFAFALVQAVRRLCPYFQAHLIVVLTNQPLKHILATPISQNSW